ncbi:MAG: histidine phosphatase family protein [Chloroflexota bacterium]
MSSTPVAILAPSKPTQILVVRHAEVYNPRDILYGRLPRFRLSDEGIRQAKATGLFLAARPVAAIYSSPLLRARQTAHILSDYHRGLRVHFAGDLLEVLSGYQGSPNTILTPGFSFFEPLKCPADETMADVWLRMARFLDRVSRRHTGETIVAVSHADPITIMRVGLLGLPLTAAQLHGAVYPARASVNQITLSPREPMSLAYFDVNDEGKTS